MQNDSGKQNDQVDEANEGSRGFWGSIISAFEASKQWSLESLDFAKKHGRDLQSPANAIFGDRLAEFGAPAAIKMQILQSVDGQFQSIPRDKKSLAEAISDPRESICVFVHGLGSSERTWTMRRKARDPIPHSALIPEDTGSAAYFVRYNTGLHISENGMELADLLNDVERSYPGKLKEINLIGHSMGGLVCRSAAYYAQKKGYRWIKKFKRQFLLGSPLLGAHQEQIGKWTTEVLDALPIPAVRVTSHFLKMRSAGIQDLGFGYLREEDWKEQNAGAANSRHPVPLCKHVRYYIVVGSLSKDPDGILATFVGDGIVHRSSARASSDEARYEGYDQSEVYEIPGLTHTNIPGDPRVYRWMRSKLRDSI